MRIVELDSRHEDGEAVNAAALDPGLSALDSGLLSAAADLLFDLIDLALDVAYPFIVLAPCPVVVEFQGALPGPARFRPHAQAIVDISQVFVDHRVISVSQG